MNVEERTKEIKAGFTSFTANGFTRRELLDNALDLYNEMILGTFGSLERDGRKLGLRDVTAYFLGRDVISCGNTVLLERFENNCKELGQFIIQQRAGFNGEEKTAYSLETVGCPHETIANVELKSGRHMTELDFVVVTEKGIFVIEVKNPCRDVVICENGNYCTLRDGEYVEEQNIGIKINDKRYLTRKLLNAAGFVDAKLNMIVAFANSKIKVSNQYEFVRVCSLSALPNIIESFEGPALYTEEEMRKIAGVLNAGGGAPALRPAMPYAEELKEDFAALKAIAEEAEENEAETESNDVMGEAEIRAAVSVQSERRDVGGILAKIGVVLTAAGVVFLPKIRDFLEELGERRRRAAQ